MMHPCNKFGAGAGNFIARGEWRFFINHPFQNRINFQLYLDHGNREGTMFRTIIIGSKILVQGLVERMTPEGRMVVRVGDRLFEGWPVEAAAPLAPQG